MGNFLHRHPFRSILNPERAKLFLMVKKVSKIYNKKRSMVNKILKRVVLFVLVLLYDLLAITINIVMLIVMLANT